MNNKKANTNTLKCNVLLNKVKNRGNSGQSQFDLIGESSQEEKESPKAKINGLLFLEQNNSLSQLEESYYFKKLNPKFTLKGHPITIAYSFTLWIRSFLFPNETNQKSQPLSNIYNFYCETYPVFSSKIYTYQDEKKSDSKNDENTERFFIFTKDEFEKRLPSFLKVLGINVLIREKSGHKFVVNVQLRSTVGEKIGHSFSKQEKCKDFHNYRQRKNQMESTKFVNDFSKVPSEIDRKPLLSLEDRKKKEEKILKEKGLEKWDNLDYYQSSHSLTPLVKKNLLVDWAYLYIRKDTSEKNFIAVDVLHIFYLTSKRELREAVFTESNIFIKNFTAVLLALGVLHYSLKKGNRTFIRGIKIAAEYSQQWEQAQEAWKKSIAPLGNDQFS